MICIRGPTGDDNRRIRAVSVTGDHHHRTCSDQIFRGIDVVGGPIGKVRVFNLRLPVGQRSNIGSTVVAKVGSRGIKVIVVVMSFRS